MQADIHPQRISSPVTRYWLNLCIASGILCVLTLIAMFWVSGNNTFLPPPLSRQGYQLLETYNDWGHGLFITVLLVSIAFLAKSAPFQWGTPFKSTLRAVRRHPLPSALLVSYALVMIHESSWFYKEILTWYDDINQGLLLSNFSLRDSFISESMGRNDFRFFPLSHQDLHLLSWLTPYVKVWAAVSAIELFATIAIAIQLIKRFVKQVNTTSLTWIACLIYLFTPSAAYNYFQFIYSERLLTLLFAVFALFYDRYQHDRQQRDGLVALAAALLGSFTKDTAILLFVTPAVVTVLTGSLGNPASNHHQPKTAPERWWKTYQLEAMLIGLIPIWTASFLTLSVLPSLYFGEARYDANLRFSSFELDLRTAWLTAFVLGRAVLLGRKTIRLQLIDSLNLSALLYSFALYALVGFKSTSYMALPVQWVALLDLLFLWSTWLEPRLQRRWPQTAINGLAILSSGLILTIEHRFAQTFISRWTDIHETQNSWRATLDQADTFARETRRKGEPVNLIFTKSWFKHSDTIKRLPFDRLIYLDPDKKEYKILEGRNRKQLYQPQPGDLFLDIGSGNKLKKYGIDISDLELLYTFNPKVSNGRIYRWPLERPE